MNKKNQVAIVSHENKLPSILPDVTRTIKPAASIYETVDAFVVNLDMPGSSKENISVSLEGGSVNVTGKMEPYHQAGATMLLCEAITGTYQRKFNIGDGIDPTSAEASYDQGVLSVKLLKKEETKPRQIKVV